VDYDNDGDLDLVAVRAVGLPTQFYRNDGHGVFTEATPEPIRSEVTHSYIAAWGDFDSDGDLDVIFGGYGSLQERFYINNGDGTFSLWTGEPARFEDDHSSVGTGAWEAWGDFDNDGYLDLFIAQCAQRNRLWRNLGNGNFEEILTGSPVDEPVTCSISGCWVDFDNDGFLDLFVAKLDEVNYLYKNNGNTNHWLEVKLSGTVSDRLAVGAKIFVTATVRGQAMRQLRVITASDSEQSLIAHFGLGDATKAQTVRIEWPSGIVQELGDVASEQIFTVVEHQDYAGPPPSFTQVAPAENGAVRVTIAEPLSGARYVLEASANLVNWTKLAARTSGGKTFPFTDTQAPKNGARFYRLVVP
jgi:hypothetical protein